MTDEDRPYITRARIQNYGCVRDVTLELTRLHALIGPNDSGKSTVLSALGTLCNVVRRAGPIFSQDLLTDPRLQNTVVSVSWSAGEIILRNATDGWILDIATPSRTWGGATDITGVSELLAPASGAPLVRWDPDEMRLPCELVQEDETLTIGEKGQNLAALYDAILSRDRTAFTRIEDGVRKRFPTVKSIWLPAVSGSQKALGVVLNDGTRVRASAMSDGLLYWLAFAAVPHLGKFGALLVEEPENGLHPSRIAEVMKTLREFSKTTQVILATHSPLVINEMQPEEVTILIRDAQVGTKATRIDHTTHFKQREKVYALGELWLSYADGDNEAALVPDTAKSAS